MDAQPIQSSRLRVKSRRRWCQYSLRTLMLLVTIAGYRRLGLAQSAGSSASAAAGSRRRGHPSARRLYRLRRRVRRPRQLCPLCRARAVEPCLAARPAGHRALSRRAAVFLSHRPAFNDTSLQRLQGLGELRILWLDGTPLTDAGLEHLRSLPHLEGLRLSETHVTDRRRSGAPPRLSPTQMALAPKHPGDRRGRGETTSVAP